MLADWLALGLLSATAETAVCCCMQGPGGHCAQVPGVPRCAQHQPVPRCDTPLPHWALGGAHLGEWQAGVCVCGGGGAWCCQHIWGSVPGARKVHTHRALCRCLMLTCMPCMSQLTCMPCMSQLTMCTCNAQSPHAATSCSHDSCHQATSHPATDHPAI
jgi:hypothetical protein